MTDPDPGRDSDSQCLQRYLGGDERASFDLLVQRHLPMVFSAASRQLDGDAAAAEDIAQEVFLRLARQARQLRHHPSLAGWLFLTTRNLAQTHRRNTHRRRHRELLATMQPAPEPELPWETLRPVLDDAVAGLPEADRTAVLWRYFERKSHAEIGGRLGLSENAARMRVERALERLRKILERHGITSTAAALGTALSSQLVADVPASLAQRIGQRVAHAAAPTTAGGLMTLLAWLGQPLRLASVALFLGGGIWWYAATHHTTDSTSNAASTTPTETVSNTVGGSPAPDASSPSSSASASALAPEATALRLELKDRSGEPIRGVTLRILRVEGTQRMQEELTSDAEGRAIVPLTGSVAGLEISSRKEGFVDARLSWRPGRGDVIPKEYQLTLEPGIRLGGVVVDASNRPLVGATVGFSALAEFGLEAHGAQSLFPQVLVSTDDLGQWETSRLNAACLDKVLFTVSLPDYERVALVDAFRNPLDQDQLRARNYRTVLGSGKTIHGIVVGPDHQPVPGARVFFEADSKDCSTCPATNTDANGTFSLRLASPSTQTVHAISPGYALSAASLAELDSSGQVQIELQLGRRLQFRVVNRQGEPIPKVSLYPQTAENLASIDIAGLVSDHDGRIVWTNAPALALVGDFEAEGWLRRNLVPLTTNGTEQRIVLDPPLEVSGTVRDRKSGEPLKQFTLKSGYWQDLGASGGTPIWGLEPPVRGEEGRFRYVIPLSSASDQEPAYVVRCEAEGWIPESSRPLKLSEGKVELHFQLEPASTTERWVVDAAGHPVPQAVVAPLTARSHVTLMNGRLQGSTDDDRLYTTDDQGRVTLPMGSAVERLVITAPAGFALIPAQELAAKRTLELASWGRIAGRLDFTGRPADISGMRLGDGESFKLYPRLGWADSRAAIDGTGNFAFPQVPPGTHALFFNRALSLGAGTSSESDTFVMNVSVGSGETVQLNLTSPSRSVKARVRWDEAVPMEWRGRAFAELATPLPSTPSGATTGSPEWNESFRNLNRERPWRGRRSYSTRIAADGTVEIRDVDAGEYLLRVAVLGTLPKDFQTPPTYLAAGSVAVTVPAQPESEALDAGEIVVGRLANP